MHMVSNPMCTNGEVFFEITERLYHFLRKKYIRVLIFMYSLIESEFFQSTRFESQP